MTTPVDTFVSIGDEIITGSTLGAGVTGHYYIFAVPKDGSRFIKGYAANIGSPNFLELVPRMMRNYPGDRLILSNPVHPQGFLTYLAGDPPRLDTQEGPVNQYFYITSMREKLSTSIHELVETNIDDVHEHEGHMVSFSPHSRSWTEDEQAKHRAINHAVRRMLAVVWHRIDVLEDLDPQDRVMWIRALPEVERLVQKACEPCSGRGWKRRLFRYINASSVNGQITADTHGAFFLDMTTDPESWGLGERLHPTADEHANVLNYWTAALEYYEAGE